MKKLFFMAVSAIAALSGCTSDDDVILGEGGKQNGVGVTTFTATIEGDNVMRTTYNSETKKAEWIASTDKINVGGAEYTANSSGAETTFTGSGATKSDDVYKAYYPASMYDNGTVTLPSTYTYEEGKLNMPMYAESETNALEFKNLCGVLAITVPSSEMTAITSFEVSSNEQMWGEFTVAMTGSPAVPAITFASKTLTEADKKITVNCGSGVPGGSTFYIPVPAKTYYPITIKVSDGTNTKIMHTTKQDGVAIARNTIYAISFTENYAKIGSSTDINLLPREFTVASGKKVRFTRSNLYWNGTAWHFEANQVGYPTNYNSNHVGHFCWTKTASVAYAQTYKDLSRSTSDKFFCGLSNTITVEGTSDLFALSNDEWSYLTESRSNASNLLKYGQTVGGKTNCMLIAPDGFNTSNWHVSNSYTLDEVNDLGLVCLPAAGYRDGDYFGNGGNSGDYWSSTPDSDNAGDAYCLHFYLGGGYIINDYRYHGLCLRLVALPQ